MQFPNLLKTGIALLGFFVSANSWALTMTLQTTDNGWYNQTGEHSTVNVNTFTGMHASGQNFNSFYNFNVDALVGKYITSASITFYGGNGTYVSSDAFETLQLWDVTTTPGGGPSVATYNDLMSGTMYGEVNVFGTSGMKMPQLTIDLNSMAFTDISADSFFSLGASIATIGSTAVQSLWYGSGSLPAAYLQIEYSDAPPMSVDESSSLALLGLGLIGLFVAARRRV